MAPRISACLSAALAAATLLPLAACRGSSDPPAAAPAVEAVEVTVATAEKGEVPVVLRGTGTLEADASAAVPAVAGGQVVATPADAGDPVAAGAVLVELDSRDAGWRLEQAEAAAEQSAEEADAAAAAVGAAELQLERARADAERVERLYATGDVSRSAVDQAKEAAALAEGQARAARDRAAEAGQARRGAGAGVAMAAKAVADGRVRAPFAGVVVERTVTVGEFVAPGTPVARLARVDPMRLEVALPEGRFETVGPGLAVEVEVPALPGRRFAGTVRRVSPVVDPLSRTFTLEVVLPNPQGTLRPGMSAVASVVLPAREPAVLVPQEAVVRAPGDATGRVYVVAGGTVESRIVRVARHPTVAQAVVAEGLDGGETVAVSALDRLSDGAAVTIRR